MQYVLFFTVICLLPLHAQQRTEDPVFRIENVDQAKLLRGNQDRQGFFIFRGRIRIVLSSGIIEADSLFIDSDRGQILAKGNLEYFENDREATRIQWQYFTYNTKTGIGTLSAANGVKNNFRVRGQSITKLDDGDKGRVIAKSFSYTPLKGILPHYTFRTKKIWFYEDGTFLARNLSYEVGGVPLLRLPLYYSGYLGTGVLTTVGFSRQRGYFIQNTYQFARISKNNWSPEFYRFKFDYYEYAGELFGFDIIRKSDPLDYVFNLDIARYKRYALLTENNQVRVTNNVNVCRRNSGGNTNCSTGQDFLPAYKLNYFSNYKYTNPEKDHVRNVHVIFENYSNYLFDYEFSNRIISNDSFQSLYNTTLDNQRYPLKTTNQLYLQYTELIRNLYFSLRLERLQSWQNTIIFRESRYQLLSEISPEFTLSHEADIGRVRGFDTPIYLKNSFQFRRSRSFQNNVLFDEILYAAYDSNLKLFLPLTRYVSLQTVFGYGLRNQNIAAHQTNINEFGGIQVDINRDLRLQNDRNNYGYAYTEDTFIFGEAATNLQMIYRYKTPFAVREHQTIYYDEKGFTNNQHVSEIEWNFTSQPRPGVLIGLRSVYDFRTFPVAIPTSQRWYYPIFDLQFIIDGLNPLQEERENLLSRNRHRFVETILSNSYIYDNINHRDHSNLLGLQFQLSGFNSKVFKRIRFIGFEFYWYHYYANTTLDQLRAAFRIDLQLSKRIYWEMIIDSRAFQPQRIGSIAGFVQDIIDGTGINGTRRQQQTNFSARLFDASLIFDLEDWELRFGYEFLQQNLLTNSSQDSSFIVFYDSKVYMALNLIRVDLGALSSRPSRFIFSRNRPY